MKIDRKVFDKQNVQLDSELNIEQEYPEARPISDLMAQIQGDALGGEYDDADEEAQTLQSLKSSEAFNNHKLA